MHDTVNDTFSKWWHESGLGMVKVNATCDCCFSKATVTPDRTIS